MPKWYFSKDRLLSRTPSRANGVDFVTESRYRREGCRFIMDMGNKLGLRYDTMATGVIYYHRFYMKQSFKTFPRWVTACACLFLAGKVEETPKKCRDIIKVAKNMLADHHFLLFGENPREEVMMYERVLLQTIKFDLQVDHPYAILLKIGKLLKGDKGKVQKLVQMAWTFVNDSLSTNLCLRQKPEVLAIAHINLAGKLASFDLKSSTDSPSNKPWWLVFCKDCSATVVEEICEEMLELYGGKKKEKSLKAKEKLNIEKNEASSNTSSSTSSPSTTNSAVPFKKKRLNSKSTETGKSPLVSSLPVASTSQPDAVESKLVQPPAVENISPALTSDALPMQTNSVAIVSKTTSYSIPSSQVACSSSTSSNISSIVPSSSAVIQSHVPTASFINPVPQNSFLSATYSGPNYGIISQGKAESIIPASTNSSFLPPTPQLDSLYPVPQNTIPTAQHPSSFVQTFSNIPLPPSHQQPPHQQPPHQQPPLQQPPHQQPPHQQPPHQQPPHQQPPHQQPPHQQPPHQQQPHQPPPHQQQPHHPPPHQQPPHQQPPHQPPLHQLYPAHHQLPPQQNAPPLPLHPHMITNQIPPTLPGNNNSNWSTLYNRPPPNNQPMGGGWLR